VRITVFRACGADVARHLLPVVRHIREYERVFQYDGLYPLET
jgi:hypothetical protein